VGSNVEFFLSLDCISQGPWLDGEQFLDDQEYYFKPDQQYHQESFD
jgi:hypothetical protein